MSVDIHELPSNLRDFIQDKSASSFGTLRLTNVAHPVFVINPFEYRDNFKETLRNTVTGVGVGDIQTDDVPKGEVWEINNIYLQSTVAGTMLINAGKTSPSEMVPMKRALNKTDVHWWGTLTLDEGRHIRCQAGIGNLILAIVGVKKYA